MGKLHKAQSDSESAYRAILIASTELSQVRSSKWKIPVLCLLEYNMAVRAAGTIFGPGWQGCNYGFRVCRKSIMLEILRKTFCMARVCFTGFNAWSYDMTWDSWEAGFTRSAFAGEFTRQRTSQQTNNVKRSNRLLAFDYLKFIKIVLCKKAKAKEKIILSNLF